MKFRVVFFFLAIIPSVVGAQTGFTVVFDPPKNGRYIGWQKMLEETQVVSNIAGQLNQTFIMDGKSVSIRFRECGEDNAYYNPEEKSLNFCYELIEHFLTLFDQPLESDEGSLTENELQKVVGATLFVFYHELGHCLIDLFDLPFTGREEDAADQLSTVLLSLTGKDGEGAVLNGAEWFALEMDTPVEISDLADVHSLHGQRFFNIICWIYGKSPLEYRHLIEKKLLPLDRAESCQEEYHRFLKGWAILLQPYLRSKSNASSPN